MKVFAKSFLLSLFFISISSNAAENGTEMKQVTYSKGRAPLSSDIAEIETIIGKSLPDWYAKHYMTLSGLQRVNQDHEFGDDWEKYLDIVATFEDGSSKGEHVTNFITVEQIKDTWRYIDYLEDYVEQFENTETFVQWQSLFPLGNLGDGVLYVAIGGQHDRKIYAADNGDYGIGLVADDIDQFITSLGITLAEK